MAPLLAIDVCSVNGHTITWAQRASILSWYFEDTLAVWDTRMFRGPSEQMNLGGEVWRIRQHLTDRPQYFGPSCHVQQVSLHLRRHPKLCQMLSNLPHSASKVQSEGTPENLSVPHSLILIFLFSVMTIPWPSGTLECSGVPPTSWTLGAECGESDSIRRTPTPWPWPPCTTGFTSTTPP